MNCPHCNTENPVPSVLYRNVENYGAATHHTVCRVCKEPIRVSASRSVVIIDIQKSDKPKDELDWVNSND